MAFILQPVCLSIRTCLSLPKLSEAAHANLSGRWGGRLFTCHLRDAQATQSAAYNTVCLNLVKPNRCNATHSPDSLKNPSVLCLSVSTFCPAPSEELRIFYLSLEIRLDPDKNIGGMHRHTVSHTYTHSHEQKWASFCY